MIQYVCQVSMNKHGEGYLGDRNGEKWGCGGDIVLTLPAAQLEVTQPAPAALPAAPLRVLFTHIKTSETCSTCMCTLLHSTINLT